VLYLKVFRAIVLALMALALIKSDRRAIVFGILWFWITLLPALPLVAHFLQYYLFLPVVGLALLVAVAFAWLYDRLARLQTAVAAAVIVCAFGGLLYVTSRSIRAQIRDNGLLGGSARIASSTLSDLKRLYPTLPSKSALFFLDSNLPLTWHHDFGGLIRMAYRDDSISTLYQSVEGSIPETQDLLVFGIDNSRLTDETPSYRRNPLKFAKFVPSNLKLALSTPRVAGRDKYTLTIQELRNTIVRVAYTVNEGPLETFGVALDAEGKVTFEVSPATKRGTYRFEAFKVAGTTDWVHAGETLTVY
jgi:hypothetical protein